MRTVFLDVETTGLDPRTDEILEIGILDDAGTVLLDSLVRPERHRRWPGAEAIHGIAPDDVADAPTLDELRPRIIAAVHDALVVICNAQFDAGFLRYELDAAAEVRCAMREFAAVYGEWSARHGGWRWQKLHIAAAHVGFAWDGASYRAINDCRATRAVWRYLCRSAARAADAGADRRSGR